MEGLIDAASECVANTLRTCLQSSPSDAGTGRIETLKLARFASKLGLVVSEVGLSLRTNEALRGSKRVFMAVDATVSALWQAEQLVAQCAGTRPSSIWPLEDAVEFQAAAAELRTAAGGLAALGDLLPQDVREDAAHVHRQLMLLSFTEDELSETEEQELEQVQHQHNNLGPLPHASAVPTAAAGASAALPSASSEAGAAPPAAPPSQFTSPEAAIDSGAVAVSRQAAAAASTPATPAALADAQQRQALQAAAAVATEAAAEVLSAEGGEVEQLVDEEEHREAGEGDAALEQDIRGEVHLPAGEEGLVVTRDGKTALPPTSPAKGAVPVRGASPLPPDPFEMSSSQDAGLGSNTLVELKSFQQGQQDLAVADDAEQQLGATADFLSLKEQQEGASGDKSGPQVFVALQQLREYESAMAAREEAEAAEQAEEGMAGEEGEPAPAAAEAVEQGHPEEALHKSRSEQAAAALAQNLEELRASSPS